MDAKSIIRDTVASVSTLRDEAQAHAGLSQALSEIKHFQARRFAATYADLLQSEHFKHAAHFFLDELYCDKDFTARDAQFARIAGALERMFPPQVVQTAVALARLHGMTEALDLAMAKQWLQSPGIGETQRYIQAWRAVGRRHDRAYQLSTTLEVGSALDRLTRKPGLRMMLRMMRRPANLAGLGALQKFLEMGFDTFEAMSRNGGGAKGSAYFLSLVELRESEALKLLFDAPQHQCEAQLQLLLSQYGHPRPD